MHEIVFLIDLVVSGSKEYEYYCLEVGCNLIFELMKDIPGSKTRNEFIVFYSSKLLCIFVLYLFFLPVLNLKEVAH